MRKKPSIKVCPTCEGVYDYTPDNFFRDASRRWGLGWACKECTKIYRKKMGYNKSMYRSDRVRHNRNARRRKRYQEYKEVSDRSVSKMEAMLRSVKEEML